ncbi:MAG: hypothetical protein C4K58_04550 [Flavobacteriaceae bacterium]|nr:MAG: hypothetical protein C4K58_04550 [Flavobacteriaceae bacterium]
MLLRPYIIPFNPPDISWEESKSQEKLQEYSLKNLPVLEDGKWVGNITKKDLIKKGLGKLKPTPYCLKPEDSLFDALNLFSSRKTDMIPIVGENEDFLGIVTLDILLDYFEKVDFLTEKGQMLWLEHQRENYSVAEISKIVESEGGKILGIYLETLRGDYFRALVKFISEDPLAITHSLERYGYQITQKFYNDKNSELIKERYLSLVQYLKI